MNLNPLLLLEKLVQYPSITPKECGIYEFVLEILTQALGEGAFEVITQEKEGVKNLFVYTPYQADEHLCFAGHIDVVPPGEGWSSDPFMPTYEGGYLYGRGVQDMKSGVSAFICAFRDFLAQNPHITQKMRFSLLLTSDEEGDGTYGTQYMLQELESKGLLPTMAIVAEPTAHRICGDTIKVGRRGSINGKITIFGKQGHVAYPQNCINPTELLGARLGKLAGVNLDEGDTYFDPSKLVITDIRGGMEVVNVTPNELKILFNVRNSPKTTIKDVESYVRSVLEGLEFDLQLKQSSVGFLTDSILVDMMSACITSVCGREPELSTSGGTSDARFFGARSIPVVEVGVPNDTIHALNERVVPQDVQRLYEIFIHFLGQYAKQ